MKAIFTGLILSAFSVTALADGPIGKAVHELPIFDAHIHYKKPAWEEYPPETVLELMDRSGVAMALVSSTPDDGTIMLWKHAPKRIVPELRPYFENWGSGNWTKHPNMLSYILERLDNYPHIGIGEFHLHRVDIGDTHLLQQIANTAMERDLYIHVHSGAPPVHLLFSLEPKIKIIWAHAGMYEPPKVIEQMMDKYTHLYADTSYREHDIISGMGINPDWRRVLTKHSDRFMVGTDTWVNDQWDAYEHLIRLNRQWLSRFERPLAEKFAYKNAERLFGKKIHNHLIGQR